MVVVMSGARSSGSSSGVGPPVILSIAIKGQPLRRSARSSCLDWQHARLQGEVDDRLEVKQPALLADLASEKDEEDQAAASLAESYFEGLNSSVEVADDAWDTRLPALDTVEDVLLEGGRRIETAGVQERVDEVTEHVQLGLEHCLGRQRCQA